MNTFYSPDGIGGMMGHDLFRDNTVNNRLHRADRMMSKAATLASTLTALTGHERKLAKRRIKRLRLRSQALRTKVRNIIRDVHRKSANFLCSNFKAIHTTPFDGGEIAGTERLHSKCVRNLMTFALAEFRSTLESYAKPRGVHVFEVGEEFTTKTCTLCGGINDNLGSVKTIKCTILHFS